MIEMLVSVLFAALSLAGIAFIVAQGQIATVDGLFFSGILALIAAVFGGNAAKLRHLRRRAKSAAANAMAAKPATVSKPATGVASSAQPAAASANSGAAAAKPPPEQPVAQSQPGPLPTAISKPKKAPKARAAEEQSGIAPGALLIRENCELPDSITADAKACLPGWRLVERADASVLRRRIEEAGWHVFYLPAEPDAAAVGLSKEHAGQRALAQVLPASDGRNAFEITRKRTRRVLGLWHVALGGHARHIQKSQFLFEKPVSAPSIVKLAVPRPMREREESRVA